MKKANTKKQPSKFNKLINLLVRRRSLVFIAVFGLVGTALLARGFPATQSVTYTGVISPDTPERSYQLSTSSGTLTAKLTPKNKANTRMRVTLRDASGGIIKSSAVGSGNRSVTISSVVTDGTYYVGVSWDGNIQSEKGFSLTVSYPIRTNSDALISGNISPSNPVMGYPVSASSGKLSAKLTPNNPVNTRMRVTIRDASGASVASDSIGEGNTSKTISANVTAGSYRVEVSWDGSIQSEKGFTLLITSDTTDLGVPLVTITGPTSDTVSGDVVFSVTARDDTGVSKVEFLIDNQVMATDNSSPYEYNWNTKTVSNGSHALLAKAYDAAGNVGSATMTITVNNTIVIGDPVDPVTPPPPPPSTAPLPVTGGGIWLSTAEIMALPMSGAAWDNVRSAAYGSWGTANLADNNSTHDTYTLAGALVAVRTGDAALREKTRQAIMSVRSSGYARVLEMSRNITSYVIAADIIDLSGADDDSFRQFISDLRVKPLTGHSGANNLRETALFSANNWGGMARAAMAAIDVYLGDSGSLASTANAHRAWLGENVSSQMTYTGTNWHANPASKAGVNRRGSLISGNNVDGVQPEDQRRTSEFYWPAPKGSYPWEGLQGALVAAGILHRAGVVPITAGDDALVRATDWLISINANPPSGDDRWQPWVMNKLRGTNYATETGISVGKNMGWTDWTHAR